MLYYAVVFFVITLIAAFFGFGGIAAGAAAGPPACSARCTEAFATASFSFGIGVLAQPDIAIRSEAATSGTAELPRTCELCGFI
jgi:hypothetical protein